MDDVGIELRMFGAEEGAINSVGTCESYPRATVGWISICTSLVAHMKNGEDTFFSLTVSSHYQQYGTRKKSVMMWYQDLHNARAARR